MKEEKQSEKLANKTIVESGEMLLWREGGARCCTMIWERDEYGRLLGTDKGMKKSEGKMALQYQE